MALTDKSKRVFEFVKQHEGENIIAADIAEALGLDVKVVNGCLTRSMQMHDPALIVRVPSKMEMADGTVKEVKLIKLTDAGKTFDPDAEE